MFYWGDNVPHTILTLTDKSSSTGNLQAEPGQPPRFDTRKKRAAPLSDVAQDPD